MMDRMLIRRRFRLMTPILASKRNNDPKNPKRIFSKVRKTPRKEDPALVFLVTDMLRWEWAFLEARDELGLEDVAVSCIMPSYWYSTKHTSTYIRPIRRGATMEQQKFESIPANHTFDMKFTLSKHVPPNTDGNGRFTRPPDVEEFDDMLTHIGEYLGMSEWGHSQTFGRFELRPPLPKNDKPNRPSGDAKAEESTEDQVRDSAGRVGDNSPAGSPGGAEVPDFDLSADGQNGSEDSV